MINGSTIMPPNIPIPMMKPSTCVLAKVAFLNNESGINAAEPILFSIMMKLTIPKTPVTYIAIESGLPQPHSRPCSATKRIGTTASTIVVAPHQSIFCGCGVWGTCKKVMTINSETAPIGRFIRKIHRQPSMNKNSPAPAKAPPMTGPNTDEVPKTARNMP